MKYLMRTSYEYNKESKKNKLLFISIIFISISSIFFILYLNLFNIGYNVFEYLFFCFRKIECLLIIPGIFILYRLNKNL